MNNPKSPITEMEAGNARTETIVDGRGSSFMGCRSSDSTICSLAALRNHAQKNRRRRNRKRETCSTESDPMAALGDASNSRLRADADGRKHCGRPQRYG